MPRSTSTRAERRTQLKRGLAKLLRQRATDPERKLWSLLRGKQIANLRFRRQQPIGPYIVDFYCSAARLVVELDGGQHFREDAAEYEATRAQWLKGQGYCVVRIPNNHLINDTADAIAAIWIAVKNSGTPLPEPPAAVRPSLKGRVK